VLIGGEGGGVAEGETDWSAAERAVGDDVFGGLARSVVAVKRMSTSEDEKAFPALSACVAADDAVFCV
jgi:hypothetical protein